MKSNKPFLLILVVLFFASACHKDKTPVNIISSAVLLTKEVTQITNSTAMCGGTITDAGKGNIVSRGVCWGINQFPTVEKNQKTNDGPGTGDFISAIINLQSNKTYYVRAYATNEVGTSYGDNIVFTTSPFSSFKFNGETIYVYPTDNGSSVWGPVGITTGAISTTDGSSNTIYIRNNVDTSAARVCADLVAYGYSDWYLPSSEELNYIYQNKTIIGGFANAEYWTSTETSNNNAASQNFQNGAQSTTYGKNVVKLCHCVRKD